MANGEDESRSKDFYQVLGLNKECTATDLRSAYKKLALRWHPDRCSALGQSNFGEEAKEKFQAVQHAYSVLSDDNKRFLYDVGVYDSDDDENGMGDFLNEMAVMMSQTKPAENVEESFEELQDLFEYLFQEDINSYRSACQTFAAASYVSCSETSIPSNKRVACEMNLGKTKAKGSNFDFHLDKFCLGVDHRKNLKKRKGVRAETRGRATGRRLGRKQKISSGRDVFCNDTGISACFILREASPAGT